MSGTLDRPAGSVAPGPAGDPGPAAPRKPALWSLFVAVFTFSAGAGLVFPLLADLQEAHGLPVWGLGAISGAFFIGAVAAQLLLAPRADQGAARVLLVVGVGLAVAASLGFALSGELWQFCVARLASGLAFGAFEPAARAMVVRADPDHAGHNLGRYSGVETGGFVLGPVIGTGLAELAGLRAPFLVMAVALAGVGVLVARTVAGAEPAPVATAEGATLGAAPAELTPAEEAAAEVVVAERVPVAPPSALGSVRSTLGLLRIPGVLVAVALEVAVYLPGGIYDSLWARYIKDLGGSTLLVGAGLALYGLPYIVCAPLGGRWADRRGSVRVATLGMLVVVPTTLAYGLVAAPLVITAIALVEAVGNALALPGAQAAMARACPPDRLAAGQGLSGAIGLLTAGAAAAVAAPVYEHAGPEVLFGGAAAAMALLVVVARRIDGSGDHPAVPRPTPPVAAGSPPPGG